MIWTIIMVIALIINSIIITVLLVERLKRSKKITTDTLEVKNIIVQDFEITIENKNLSLKPRK